MTITTNTLTSSITNSIGLFEKPSAIAPVANHWAAVENTLKAHYHNPDLQAARAVFASIAAHRLTGAPVWPMLVGPPGSMKTELLRGIQHLQNVHFVDQITAQTFISGHIVEGRQTAPSGLLHRIGKQGILVYPDFSTILAMKPETKASILADMRRIYDGELTKQFGTSIDLGSRTWKGRITFAVAATSEVDKHYSIFSALGERFVMIRWRRPDGIEAALTAMNQNSAEARTQLQRVVTDLFKDMPNIEPTIPEDIQHMVASLADFTTRARTQVARSGYTKEMQYLPEPESSTRLAQQLAQLAKGSALLDCRQCVDDSDYTLVKRVAFDCIPTIRRKAFEALIRNDDAGSGLPKTTLHYVMEDLEALELIESGSLAQNARIALENARVICPEVMQVH